METCATIFAESNILYSVRDERWHSSGLCSCKKERCAAFAPFNR